MVAGTAADPLAVVESGYELAVSDAEWISRITAAVSHELSGPLGTVGYRFERRQMRYVLGPTTVCEGDPILAHLSQRVIRAFSTDDVARFFRQRTLTSSYRSCVQGMPKEGTAYGMVDFYGIVIGDQDSGVAVGAPRREPAPLPEKSRLRWQRVCAHLTSALRLRAAIVARGGESSEEAVLTPDGVVLHASGGAESRDARAVLRQAVRAMERARGALRRKDPLSALTLWRELTAGRWTLVERFESGGRRLLLAHVNPPEAAPLRELTPRQTSILRLLLDGHAAASAATVLNISQGAISQHITSILKKLRLRSRGELLILHSKLARLQSVDVVDLDGVAACLIDIGPHLAPQAVGLLSPAERQIAGWLLDGLSNSEIAENRGCAYRTVANQVARVYEKLGVTSRSELALRLEAASQRPL